MDSSSNTSAADPDEPSPPPPAPATVSEKSAKSSKQTPVFKKGAPSIKVPSADGEEKTFAPKISEIVDSITRLTLVEISELNEALKKRLNLPEFSAMSYSPQMNTAAPQTTESMPKVESKKTSFKVKLVRYDEKKKIPLIKEVKTLVPGLNLVQVTISNLHAYLII
ncbi:unnamed protein product [Soboliphyme baturini]|uniref:Ribosomal_L12_N domain-containing protein n=1 Tax=Soboliphyme baturini TaxID=241478 RepID=A0A183JAR1_9BILA|nr:unnamed protein product [Soboliphyme baturini]